MDLSRQEYPALLTGTEPDHAVDILNNRVAVINKIHADIADWLAERRKIEEQYAVSLRKLARRPQQDNASALGVFQAPWQRITSSVEDLAQSHETLAAKIQADVETPLRQYSTTNRELTSMSNMSGNLASLAKDLSNARRKAQKLDAKGSDKAEGAKSNVDDASSQWESQAPFVFEQLQAADEARVNHLRDVLTQFKTHELDQIEKARASAEVCLNGLLNVETADEIRSFAAKAKQQTRTAPSRRDSLATPVRALGGGMPPAPPPPRNTSLGDRNGSTSQQDTLAPLPDTPKEKKLSGLKRLGTVMGRRKNAAPPPPPSDKKKDNRKSFMPFKRSESSRSFQDLDSTGRDLSPAVSHDRPSTRPDAERPPQTQESRVSNASPRPTSNGMAATNLSEERSSLPQTSNIQPVLTPEPNDLPALPSQAPTSRPDPFAQAAPSPTGEESARAFEIRDKPIAEDANAAQQAMDNMANQLRMQAQTSGLSRGQGTVRGRRDVRNTMFFPNPPQQEVLPAAAAAGAITASPSLASPITATDTAPTSPTSATAMQPPTNTILADKPQPPRPDTVDSAASDTQSMHSSYSAAALGPHHQEMTDQGLNASIVETVNTWLSDEGVTKSFVIGEVALAYNRTSSASPEKELVRIQNYHQLEKCAQNPQFVQPSDAGEHQPGTYHVNVPSISRSIPTVAFKYQLHINENNLSVYSPILVTQAWQIVEGQASIILLYSLNPAFAQIANPGSSSAVTEITLKNVSISIALDKDSPRALSAQMMPVQNAHFKKRNSSVAWRFPELVVRQNQERLLVRFMIETNGIAKRGGVDLKFEAPGMLASALGLERFANVSGTSDPFADEDEGGKSPGGVSGGQNWEDVQARKTLVSGKYTAA